MADRLTLIHTSNAHCATFDALRDQISADTVLVHHVREEWLARAREEGITTALRTEIAAFVADQTGPLLCTCTTLGAVMDDTGAIRIDRPMMTQAAAAGGRICLAYCLDSTAEPSLSLLTDCIARAGTHPVVDSLFLGPLWPVFDSGDTDAFAQDIAMAVRNYVLAHPDTVTVILAQASMAQAEAHLSDLPAQILSSPVSALKAALRIG